MLGVGAEGNAKGVLISRLGIFCRRIYWDRSFAVQNSGRTVQCESAKCVQTGKATKNLGKCTARNVIWGLFRRVL